MNPDDPRIRKDPDGIPQWPESKLAVLCALISVVISRHLPTPAGVEALADQRSCKVHCSGVSNAGSDRIIDIACGEVGKAFPSNPRHLILAAMTSEMVAAVRVLLCAYPRVDAEI